MAQAPQAMIRTARLVLDPLHPADAAGLFACRADPDVARYQGWKPASVDEASAFITEQAQRTFGAAGWCQLAIRRRTGELVGDFGVHFPAALDDPIEFGLSLGPSHQRKGYAREVMVAVFPGSRTPASPTEKIVPIGRQRQKAKGGAFALPIRGLIPGMAVHFAGCCHPLPGDRIVGIVTTGKGVTIHTIDCETLEGFADTPERWIDVSWEKDSEGDDSFHTGRLNVVIANQLGSLGSLTTVIAKNNGNIMNLKIVNRSQDFFEILIDVEVKDVKHLTNIIAALRATPSINSVERARG